MGSSLIIHRALWLSVVSEETYVRGTLSSTFLTHLQGLQQIHAGQAPCRHAMCSRPDCPSSLKPYSQLQSLECFSN